jgi:DNA-binding HxlR family transcriptional regulator
VSESPPGSGRAAGSPCWKGRLSQGGLAQGGLSHAGCDAGLVRAFSFLGKRWNGVLIATLAPGPQSFSELRRSVTGISDSVLSERLAELVSVGIVERRVDPGPPVGVAYQLSGAGAELRPALDAIAVWAADHLSGDSGCSER